MRTNQGKRAKALEQAATEATDEKADELKAIGDGGVEADDADASDSDGDGDHNPLKPASAAPLPTKAKRGRPRKAAGEAPPKTVAAPAKAAKGRPKAGPKATKAGAKAAPDPNSEILMKPFQFSESLSRLEVTACTPTRKRLCLLSFKIQDKHRKTLPGFVKQLRTLLDSGKATKSMVIAQRTAWLKKLT